MSSHSVHYESFWSRLFGRRRSHDQNLPPGWKYQHSRPVYQEEPESPTSVRQRAVWAEQMRQLGMHPALVEQPVRAPITPIPEVRNTDSIPQLALPVPKEERNREVISELDTSKGLPGLPHWVLDLRDNPPVVEEPFNPLGTMRADRDSQPMRVVAPVDLGLADLTTWQSPEAQDLQVSKIIAQIDHVRYPWLYEELPVLAPLSQDDLAASDRVAQPKPVEDEPFIVQAKPEGDINADIPTQPLEPAPASAFTELLRRNSSTLHDLMAVTKRIAATHKKESEQ